MRTTLTLDDDVAANLKGEARRSGRSFRNIVNDTLRRGLATRQAAPAQKPFKVTARDLGKLLPGLEVTSD
jgi:plasmid stability protein